MLKKRYDKVDDKKRYYLVDEVKENGVYHATYLTGCMTEREVDELLDKMQPKIIQEEK